MGDVSRFAGDQARLLLDVDDHLLDRDLTDRLDRVIRATLPAMGDGVALSRLDEQGFRTTHVAATRPDAEPILGKARDASEEVNLDEAPAVVVHVLETRQPLRCTVEEALTWPGMPEAPGLEEALAALGVAEFLIVPLVVGDRAVGALSWLAMGQVDAFDDGHVALGTAVAVRVAAAMEFERLRRTEAATTRALQSTLLPPVLPPVDGLELAARYRAADDAEVGGDFYDLFLNDDGGWTALLGDVSGKGPDAAAIAGLARYTARALAMSATDPEGILERLNTAVQRQSLAERFLTGLCAVGHRDGDDHVIRLADAGHPPALVRRADGTVETVLLWGTVLGMFAEPRIEHTTITLAPGDVLVLYTDGAIEARRAGGAPFGVEGLSAALGRIRSQRPANIASRLLEAVARHEDQPRDDLAMLVLRARRP